MEAMFLEARKKIKIDDDALKLLDKLPENIKFFKEFKKELKLLFKQEEIFISCTEITWV